MSWVLGWWEWNWDIIQQYISKTEMVGVGRNKAIHNLVEAGQQGSETGQQGSETRQQIGVGLGQTTAIHFLRWGWGCLEWDRIHQYMSLSCGMVEVSQTTPIYILDCIVVGVKMGQNTAIHVLGCGLVTVGVGQNVASYFPG